VLGYNYVLTALHRTHKQQADMQFSERQPAGRASSNVSSSSAIVGLWDQSSLSTNIYTTRLISATLPLHITYSDWPKVSNQAAKYGDMWKKMPATRQFFLQARINLGHFWSLVFSHVTKTTVDVYNDVSFLFIFEIQPVLLMPMGRRKY